MSTSAITGSLLSSALDSSSTANQFVTDINKVEKDLQGGNLSAAQQDYVTLSSDLENGTESSTATTSSSGITVSLLSTVASSSGGLDSLASTLNQLGTDLTNGNLSGAQGDLLSLNATVLNAASSSPSTTASQSSAKSTATTLDRSSLIKAIVQSLGSGDTSGASLALTQLSSISSSQGASALDAFSSSLGSSTPATDNSSSELSLLA